MKVSRGFLCWGNAYKFAPYFDGTIKENKAIFTYDLIRYELFKVFSNDINVKKCKCCGHYFVPKGRTDIEYFNRINAGETKPCNEIGTAKIYKESRKENIIYHEYNSAYKKYHSRDRNGKITTSVFFM